MGEREGPSLALVVLAVFSVALAARIVPMFWSPLPATLDGFRYAALAETVLETGTLPIGIIQSDELVFTLALVATSALTGVPPLHAAQPFVVVAGSAVPVVGAALAHRLALERGWDGRRVATAAALTGFALAVDGIVVRRTGVPDEEALGLLLAPLLVIAAHRWLTAGGMPWGVTTGFLLVALPPLHNLSSLLAILGVWGLVSVHAVRARGDRALLRCVALGVGAWSVFFLYFEVASRLGLALTYSGLIRPHFGLFLAWLVVIPLGAIWMRGTSDRVQRLVVGGPILLCLTLIGLNAFTPLFPGTVLSPPLVLALLLAFVVPVAFATVGAPEMGRGSGLVSLAGYLAPLGLTYYAFSASLTPSFFDVVLRAQTFGHLPVIAIASLGVVASGQYVRTHEVPLRRGIYAAIVVVFLAGMVTTLPLAYLNLDSGSAPSTTFESEFEATGFATEHVEGPFATDDSLARVVGNYHSPLGPPILGGPTGSASVGPTRNWLAGGVSPGCPVLSQRSWTTTGAHLYPAQPASVTPEAYRRFLADRHLVYDAGGHDPLVLSVPTEANSTGC